MYVPKEVQKSVKVKSSSHLTDGGKILVTPERDYVVLGLTPHGVRVDIDGVSEKTVYWDEIS